MPTKSAAQSSYEKWRSSNQVLRGITIGPPPEWEQLPEATKAKWEQIAASGEGA